MNNFHGSPFAGVKVLFRVALVLSKSVLGKPEQIQECPSMYETLEKFRHLPSEILHEEYLIREVRQLSIRIFCSLDE